MRRASITVLAVGLALVALPAFAGGAECRRKAEQAAHSAHADKKCTMTAEECRKWMAAARERPWLGVDVEADEAAGTLTVLGVVPDSPADRAGFRPGDQLVAMNGVAYDEANKDKLAAIKKDLAFGESVSYTVRRDGEERRLSATLARMPESVYTAMVEEHAKEHTEIATR